MKKPAEEIAADIKAMATKLGWSIEARGCVLTINKQFEPGSNAGLVECDGEYYSILGLLPTTSPGSVWGTDCGGIGALTAKRIGSFTMHKSGGAKSVLKQLNK